MTGQNTIHSAVHELLDLAGVMRPYWPRERLHAALIAAHHAGWAWRDTFALVARLLIVEDAGPEDILEQIRDPRRRPRTGTGPSAEYTRVRERLRTAGGVRA